MSCTAASVPLRIALLQLRVSGDKLQDIRRCKAAIQKACRGGTTTGKTTISKTITKHNHASSSSSSSSSNVDVIVLPEMWQCPYDNKFFKEYAEHAGVLSYKQFNPASTTTSSASYNKSDNDNESDSDIGPSCTMMRDAAKEFGVVIIGGSIPEIVPYNNNDNDNNNNDSDSDKKEKEYKLYNTCFCFGRKGELIGRHRKVHLFDIGMLLLSLSLITITIATIIIINIIV